MYAKISAWRPPGFVLPAAIQIVRYGYLFLIGLALLTFGGWLLPWPMLLRWLPGMPLISCDTAVCLILAAVALAAQVRESAAVLRLVSILLTALSGVYLLTPLVRVCFSVHYFLPGLTAAVTPAAHFRIASGTALVFMLFGISLLLMAQRRPGKFALRLAGGLSTAIVAIGVLGCVTALTGILSQHTLSSFLIRMAIPTATGACVLGICAQAVWWTKSAHSAQQVASSWANFALLGLLILFAGVDSTIASNADQAMKTRTDFGVVSSQINLVRTIVTAIREAEIGMRGFLLTGEDAFLSDYERATKEAFAGVKTLRQNAPDAETEEFRYAAAAKLAELAQTLSLTRAPGKSAAFALVKSRVGFFLMLTADARASVLIKKLRGDREVRLNANKRSLERIQKTIVLSYADAVFLVGLSFCLLRLEIRRRANVENQLRESARGLEDRVAERTAEIGEQANALRDEINRRLLNEKAIHETELRLQAGLGFAHVVAWSWDRAGEQANWSGPVEKLFGVTAGHLKSYASFRSIIFPADRNIIDRKVIGSFRDGGEWAAEFRVVSPTGVIRWIAGAGGVMLNAQGNVTQMAGVNFDITERRQAEQKLALSELQFRELAESVPQIVWKTNAAGDFEYRNHRWHSLTGLPVESASQQLWEQVMHPDDSPAWQAQLLESRRNGCTCEMEFRLWDAGKQQYRWHLGRKEPSLDQDGALICCYGTCTDIHGRKMEEIKLAESERALRKRDQQLALLLDAGATGDFTWDLRNDEVMADASVLALYGDPGRTGVRPASRFRCRHHPDDRESIDRAVQKACHETGVLEVDFRVVWPDGSLHWLTCRGIVVRDEAGTASSIRGLHIDISERKAAELRVQESERQLREQADAMPLMVWRSTQDGQIDYCNARWQDYTGYSSEQAKALGWHLVAHPDDLLSCAEQTARGFSSEIPFTFEFRAKRASDGAYRWLLAQWFPFRGRDGKLQCWFGAAVDIDDQKTLRERLDTEVVNRTSELCRSLGEKEMLLKEVHHRVKNNLQVISSLLSIQEHSMQDSQASAALKDSRQRVLSMALIHERLYGGDDLAQIDFGEYAQTLVNELLSSFYDPTTQVVSRFNTSTVRLNIDQAIPCGLILNELVTNAIKYAYPKGQSGEILVELRETESALVRLTVSDHGVGLPEGFNWNESKSMGLPIADMLAKQIDGKLSVRSQNGTSFSVEFPRQRKEALS